MYFQWKQSKNIFCTVVLVAIIFALSSDPRAKQPRVYSQKIDSVVNQKLAQASPDELISVELAVPGAISAQELTRFLDSAYVKLDDKRRAGLHLLRETAARTQQDLLAYLHSLESSGGAVDIKSNWLTNTISVKLKAAIVDSVAQQNDVLSIFQNPAMEQIVPDYPEPNKTFSSSTQTVESNLTTIGADTAWAMGYTGKGRIVCVFDYEGVDGHHPALESSWKGQDGDSVAAWWTWGGGSTFPVAHQFIEDDSSHGTALTGIMVGHDDVSGDTIGVAPGATWIAANNFEWGWAADPDNNPNTTADMPDVINISAGYPQFCIDLWQGEIDMVEALGIVVICAAGNTGPNPYTIWSPASHAGDSLTNFAVGSIDHRYGNGEIYWNSSRGPSSCDSVSIKPNVTAPGAYILCSIPGGGYAYRGGTSMAAPHVAGAVAILRQFAPDATARQIKAALLAGATPHGVTHPNNDYGWGVISIPKSLEFLAQTFRPDLRISTFDYDSANIKDTVYADVRVANRGYSADSVYLKFTGHFPGLRILTDSIYFGHVDLLQEVTGQNALTCVFEDTLLPGPVIPVTYTIHAAGNYVDTLTAEFHAGTRGKIREGFIPSDWWSARITNFGGYTLGQSLVTDTCTQYCDDLLPFLYYGAGLLIGEDTDRVSDHDLIAFSRNSDGDFGPDANHTLIATAPGTLADYETDCLFNDGMAENQIGIEVHQHTYFWSDPNDNDCIVIEYELSNPTPKHLAKLYVGLTYSLQQSYIPTCLSLDSQILRSSYSSAEHLGYIEVDPCQLDTIRLQGVAVLNSEGDYSYLARSESTGLTEAEKYHVLTGGIRDTGLTANLNQRLAYYVANGPFSLEPGQSDTIAFAIVCGNSLDELKTAVHNAHKKWKQVSPSQNLPKTSMLSQNYPNPFNPSTTIAFDLPNASKVKLIVFNILGQEVAKLIDEPLLAGSHQVIWDGNNKAGKQVASGIYFYRLVTESFSQSKKMILLR